MPEGDNELSDEYCKETDICCPLGELLGQFPKLKDQFTSLQSTIPQSIPEAELLQLTDKLQHLMMMLQPAHQPSEEQCTKPCRPTQTLCIQHGEKQTLTQPCSKISPHLMGRTPQR